MNIYKRYAKTTVNSPIIPKQVNMQRYDNFFGPEAKIIGGSTEATESSEIIKFNKNSKILDKRKL